MNTLTEDIKDAMKAKNATKLSTLRMLKAAVQNAEIAKKAPLEEQEFLGVIRKEVKKRHDMIELVGVSNLVAVAEAQNEISILEHYLPVQLSGSEILALVEESIAEAQATTKKDFGKVMKLVTAKAAGRADGKTVSNVVQSLLK